MDGFATTIYNLMVAAGIQEREIHVGRFAELPGYFRPSKRWDIAVIVNKQLLAAIELKSQVGSFGNNFNNCTEEALGIAVDTWTAYREGAFRQSPQPLLGYLLLLQQAPGSTNIVGMSEPNFGVFPEFRNTSYAMRYELFCRKLVLERQFTAACFLMTDEAQALALMNYSEPAPDLSAQSFLGQLVAHCQLAETMRRLV